MANVLIGGGTGSIGQVLSKALREAGHHVRILSRTPDLDNNIYYWNPAKNEIDGAALDDVHVVFNLAGAGIADRRWTPSYKKTIIASRTQGNALFHAQIVLGNVKPDHYISASATGIYGNRGDEWLNENSSPGDGFLSETCKAWEKSLLPIQERGIDTTILRLGIVLFDGGALGKMLPSYNFGVGAYFGDGSQWYSWIHIQDVVRMIQHCMDNKLTGIYNAVASQPVTNKAFAKAISLAKRGNHLIAPVPSPLLKLGMGEMSAVVLDSTRVRAKKIQDTNFTFKYPELMGALKSLIS